MGYEKSEPRNNQILLWGVVSVISLMALVPLFQSYFGKTFGQEFDEKVNAVPNTPYQELRDAQRARLNEGGLTIDAAKQQLAMRGRAGTPVMPRPNDGPDATDEDYEASLAPLTGWSRLSNERRTEAARRAMLGRRQQLQGEQPTGIEDPDASSLEAVQREGADAPSFVVEDRPPVVPAREPVRAPRELVRPSAMQAAPTAMEAPAP